MKIKIYKIQTKVLGSFSIFSAQAELFQSLQTTNWAGLQWHSRLLGGETLHLQTPESKKCQWTTHTTHLIKPCFIFISVEAG